MDRNHLWEPKIVYALSVSSSTGISKILRVRANRTGYAKIMYNKEYIVRDGLNEGYKYFCDKDHPLARGNAGMVLLHRHIASLKLGRWVGIGEVVHHIDEDRLNNCPTNLEVLLRSEHARIHADTYLVEITCPICANIFQPREPKQVYCSNKCRSDSSVRFTIDKGKLEHDIWYYPYTKLTHKYGLSDVGLKKRAVALGCKIPPAYFHNRDNVYKDKLRIENSIN